MSPGYSLSSFAECDFETSLSVECLDIELMRFYCLEQLVKFEGPLSLKATADL